jgi:hypothetical protein
MSEQVVLRPRLWTVKDVARECQVGRDRAFELIRAAGAIKLGRSLRCRPEDLDRLLAQFREDGAG